MLPAPMNRYLVACIFFFIGMTLVRPVHAQDSFAAIDLLYPEFAHPREDALRAIKERDYRFVATDRRRTTPGIERYPRLKEIYGVKVIKQRFRIFSTRSQNFSFGLRARAYAYDYNQTLLEYLLKRRKNDASRQR